MMSLPLKSVRLTEYEHPLWKQWLSEAEQTVMAEAISSLLMSSSVPFWNSADH